jgi:hypothetical protein
VPKREAFSASEGNIYGEATERLSETFLAAAIRLVILIVARESTLSVQSNLRYRVKNEGIAEAAVMNGNLREQLSYQPPIFKSRLDWMFEPVPPLRKAAQHFS